MWRSAAILTGACLGLFGQSIKIQKPGPIQKPRGDWQVPGKIQVPGAIQKVKDQCKSKLIVGSDALFDFDKSELTPSAEMVLSQLGPMIRKEGPHPVSVEGHTDAVGTPDYNQSLSEKRAKAVESWLENREYVTSGATVSKGFGKNHPIAPNDTQEGRQKNRRVEVVIDTCTHN